MTTIASRLSREITYDINHGILRARLGNFGIADQSPESKSFREGLSALADFIVAAHGQGALRGIYVPADNPGTAGIVAMHLRMALHDVFNVSDQTMAVGPVRQEDPVLISLQNARMLRLTAQDFESCSRSWLGAGIHPSGG